MAYLKGRTLFFTTSPRTPLKMIPEIELLAEHFIDNTWNKQSQIEFMKVLAEDERFKGFGSYKEVAFSARDRINRGPKSLGFVDLSPSIKITEQGINFISGKRTDEVLLRQLLKFQLPSPYHKVTANTPIDFNIKPYLEIIRLISVLEKITFDELMLFGMQLTDYNDFQGIVDKILDFRTEKDKNKGRYKKFLQEKTEEVILDIYEQEIIAGETGTRESNDKSLKKFITTKRSNLRDYTDACFRYLRATGIVNISQRMTSLSIVPEKKLDVDFILENISRQPVHIENEKAYKTYLFSSTEPVLFSDNEENLRRNIWAINPELDILSSTYSIDDLKDIYSNLIDDRKNSIISKDVEAIKTFEQYEDIIETFTEIRNRNLYDLPLMFEWNTWRSLNMITSGNIIGNFRIDDFGQPMSTAAGNMADIVCDFDDFGLTVEVTLQTGQRQYEMEGEPVSRHLAKYKKTINKPTYCLFIAPTVNPATIAHFYMLHFMKITYYGGNSVIVPIDLATFNSLIINLSKKKTKLSNALVKSIFTTSMDIAKNVGGENEWFESIRDYILGL